MDRFKNEAHAREWLRYRWGSRHVDRLEPRSGAGVGFPDTIFRHRGSYIPVEFKFVDEAQEDLAGDRLSFFGVKVRPSQRNWLRGARLDGCPAFLAIASPHLIGFISAELCDFQNRKYFTVGSRDIILLREKKDETKRKLCSIFDRALPVGL